nr:unnamed protein product [Callosobruchus analis]
MAASTGGDDAAGFAPSFIEKPKIIPNESGTLITMKCKCKAKPKPDVSWFRGTTIVKESSKIKVRIVDIEEDKYELSLEIKVSSNSSSLETFFYGQPLAKAEILWRCRSAARGQVSMHVCLEALQVIAVGKQIPRQLIPQRRGPPKEGMLEKTCPRSGDLYLVRVSTQSLSSVHLPDGLRCYYLRKLTRTSSVVKSVKQGQGCYPSSMFQAVEISCEVRRIDQSNRSILDRIQKL